MTPRRYQFDNPLPTLPAVRETAPPVVYQPTPLAPVYDQAQPQVVHIHQAPPDRTLQRTALGAGMGAGALGAAVVLGPLLIEAVHALVAGILSLSLFAAVIGWAVVQVVQSVGSKRGQAAAKTIRKHSFLTRR